MHYASLARKNINFCNIFWYPKNNNTPNVVKTSSYLFPIILFSQPISVGYRLGQRVRIMFLSICRYVCPLLSPSSFSPSSQEEGSSLTCVGAVPGTSHSMILYLGLDDCSSREMFPREYLSTQGRDDSSTARVFQCTILYHTI